MDKWRWQQGVSLDGMQYLNKLRQKPGCLVLFCSFVPNCSAKTQHYFSCMTSLKLSEVSNQKTCIYSVYWQQAWMMWKNILWWYFPPVNSICYFQILRRLMWLVPTVSLALFLSSWSMLCSISSLASHGFLLTCFPLNHKLQNIVMKKKINKNKIAVRSSYTRKLVISKRK